MQTENITLTEAVLATIKADEQFNRAAFDWAQAITEMHVDHIDDATSDIWARARELFAAEGASTEDLRNLDVTPMLLDVTPADPSEPGSPLVSCIVRVEIEIGGERATVKLDDEDNDWSGSLDPVDPDNFWVDDETGERVNAKTGERTPVRR